MKIQNPLRALSKTRAFRLAECLSGILFLSVVCSALNAAPKAPASAGPVEALLYSSMPSTFDHNAVMAMDGDSNTYFKTVYGMGDGDDFLVMLSHAIPMQQLTIVTGTPDGDDTLTNGFVETSPDGDKYNRSVPFNSAGVADASYNNAPVECIRIRVNRGQGASSLVIREITIKSSATVSHVQYGPGRGFQDISQAPDLAVWSATAERQMEQFWPDTVALLYSYKFIPPNMVTVQYRTGPNVTGVAATGGGIMTVNADWCRKNPDDTGLTVHEDAHVVQSMPKYDPVWLIEGTADYIRWICFEPQHFTYRIDPNRSTYHDGYRTTAAFLRWCELHYDNRLVTKLNDAVRYGKYTNDLFKTYCGKDVDTLWKEFVAAYEADPKGVIATPVAAADVPRELPVIKAGSSVPVDLSTAFNTTGIYADGVKFSADAGADGGGAAYSGTLLGKTQTVKGVQFNIGPAGAADMITPNGNAVVALPSGTYASLWLLASGVQGSQMAQPLIVTYADGTTKTLAQNFSDWYQPQSFPGEKRAVSMPYRLYSDGAKDTRPFNIYCYGFSIDSTKQVKSLTLPTNQYLRILAVSLAN
jgi:hypothetical protein